MLTTLKTIPHKFLLITCSLSAILTVTAVYSDEYLPQYNEDTELNETSEYPAEQESPEQDDEEYIEQVDMDEEEYEDFASES